MEQQKFAAYDAQGNIVAYYDSVDSPVPEGLANIIEITYDEWQACINRQGHKVVGGVLVPPAEPTVAQRLADAKRVQIALIARQCEVVIVSGFESSALGEPHSYPSQDADQRNLQSAVLAALVSPVEWVTPIWCASGQDWSFLKHTVLQVQHVNADWVAARVATQQRYADRVAQINAATSVEEIEAISW